MVSVERLKKMIAEGFCRATKLKKNFCKTFVLNILNIIWGDCTYMYIYICVFDIIIMFTTMTMMIMMAMPQIGGRAEWALPSMMTMMMMMTMTLPSKITMMIAMPQIVSRAHLSVHCHQCPRWSDQGPESRGSSPAQNHLYHLYHLHLINVIIIIIIFNVISS